MKDRIELDKGAQGLCLAAIKKYFREDRGEDLGDLAAQLVLDFVAEKIGPHYYNLGIRDAGKFLAERLEDLGALEKIL